MARLKRVLVEANKLQLLTYLAHRADQRPGEGTSLRVMEDDLGRSRGSLRSSCRALVSEGLLRVDARFDEDGGQKANVYLPTLKARRILADQREKDSLCPE